MQKVSLNHRRHCNRQHRPRFVADTGNRRIQIFTSDGKVLNEFAIQAAKGSQHPSDPVTGA